MGGPEVLELESYEPAPPGPGEALVRQTAIGLNFIDTYFRTGLYPAPTGLPFTPGNEAAGVVEAVGDGVTEVRVGQRVAYAGALGAYADRRVVPSSVLVPLPDSVGDEQAAAMMLKGMTAQYLLRQTYEREAGRHDPVPCRGRRRRADRLPVGQAAGGDGDRHGRQSRQGGAGAGAWLRPRHPLQGRGFRRPRQGDHRRQGRARGL